MRPVRVKVAYLDELPPGRGKVLIVAGREVTVVNSEGRVTATARATPRSGPAVETVCDLPGRRFTVGPAMSPVRLRADELRYEVTVEGGSVYVLVEP